MCYNILKANVVEENTVPNHFERKTISTLLKKYGLLLLATLLISGALLSLKVQLRRQADKSIFCCQSGSLADALSDVVPDQPIALDGANNALYHLENGAVAVETFQYVANPALRQNLAKWWYPLYQTSFVIVADRAIATAEIKNFTDLKLLDSTISIPSNATALGNLVASLAYRSDDGSFDMRRATEQLLTPLQANRQLVYDDYAAAVILCYDYQAAALLRDNPQRIVIAPSNQLVFKGGLLTKSRLPIDLIKLRDNLQKIGYRTINATNQADCGYDQNKLCQLLADVPRSMRRHVDQTYRLQTADGREHFIVGMLFAVIVVIWSLSFYVRSSQPTMRKAIALNGILLVFWLSIRLVKYLLYDSALLDSYLWYGFYIAILLLPVNFLWLILKCDQLTDDAKIPAVIQALFLINLPIIGLVFSNNWHNLFFIFDMQQVDWNRHYSYGPLFWSMYAFMIGEYLAALVILLYKAFKSKQKRAFIAPLSIVFCTVLISLLYVNRLLPTGFDITLVIVLLNLLFFEAALRSGLISVNGDYDKIFELSTLNMQIVNRTGQVVLSAKSAKIPPISRAVLCRDERTPQLLDSNTRLHIQRIDSGYVCYLSDISQINQLRQKLSSSIAKLQRIRQLLSKQKQIKQAAATAQVKVEVYANLQRQVYRDVQALQRAIDQLKGPYIDRTELALIALKSCYLKRSTNWFFREYDQATIAVKDLQLYLEELAEIANYSAIKVLISQRGDSTLATRRGTLIYKFFYSVLLALRAQQRHTLLVQIVNDNPVTVVNFMPAGGALQIEIDRQLKRELHSAGGCYDSTDLADAFSLSLRFAGGDKR